jgi:hypothetical protein
MTSEGETMKDDESPARYSVQIGGSVSGQVGVGSDISQTMTSPAAGAAAPGLAELIEELRRTVAAKAPPEQREEAVAKVEELGAAVTASGQPDVRTMASVRNWFALHLPKVIGSVMGLIVHPLVGKVVEAAGDLVVDQFKDSFGT